MKNLLTLLLIGLTIAGCATAPHSDRRPDQALKGTISPTAPGLPPTATLAGGSGVLPEVTAAPPGFPLESPPLSNLPDGWGTFTSSRLAVSVDYPLDWSAAEAEGGVTFSSPNGATVLLEQVRAEAASQDCTTLVNSYGQAADLCTDAVSGRFTATFELALADGATRQIRLSTVGSQALDVYRLMVDSLRPTQ